MIGDLLQDSGFQGLGNGHDQGAWANRPPAIQEWQPTPAPSASPDDSFAPEDSYEAAVRKIEIAIHGAQRGARARDALLFGRVSFPPLPEAREGPERAPTASPVHLTGPAQFLNKLLGTWRLDHDDALALLGLEPSQRTYLDDLLTGYAPPAGRDVKDRIAYLFTIRKTLSGLFWYEAVENDWLREPHALLEDREPMTLMLEGSMENLLLVKEYVDTAAGL